MAIRKFTENTAVISSLPDVPSPPQYNAAVLKGKFDEAATKIKNYINDTLIPDIEASGTGASAAVRRQLVKYDKPGSYVFSTTAYPSVGNVYDVVLVGGGGGGSVSSTLASNSATGGGSGAVTKITAIELSDGEYSVSVGSAGTSASGQGTNGHASIFSSDDYSVYLTASGGGGSSQSSKIGYSGGIGGSDSVQGDGSSLYGHGGDNEYGRGARGAILNDDVKPSVGIGAGGWGVFAPRDGAVIIYGYGRI